jgi:Uma2 family endonuclease
MCRWEAMPEVKKAELIGGIVYMPSPLTPRHARADNRVHTWLGHYAAYTPGSEAGDNATWYLLDDAPQPDAYLRILPECGGSSTEEGGYGSGAPELVAEICLSSTSYDLHQKMELYQKAGVPEYLAVLLREREVRWHRLIEDSYQLLRPGRDGVIRSVEFPGLWLEERPFLEGNMVRVLETLQQGLNSPDHVEFVKRLAAK